MYNFNAEQARRQSEEAMSPELLSVLNGIDDQSRRKGRYFKKFGCKLSDETVTELIKRGFFIDQKPYRDDKIDYTITW